jgi:hypothetical protein
MRVFPVAALLVATSILGACGAVANKPQNSAVDNPAAPTGATTSDPTQPTGGTVEMPSAVDVEVVPTGDGTYRFTVTVSSPYDGPDRYADAWRIVGPDGEVYGTRELTHHHATEQPFTRSLDGVAVPDHVATVMVEVRDLVHGWSDGRLEVQLGT